MEDSDSSLWLARRLPDLVAEGWEGRGRGIPSHSATFIL